jgi:hypothetical protein
MKIRDAKSGKTIETSIGEIVIFNLSVGDSNNINEDLNEDSDVNEYIRVFVKYTCFKKNDLESHILKPKEPLLTEEDIDKLSDVDFENIAKTYIEGNVYLFRKTILDTQKSDKSFQILSIKYGDIEYPKLKNESYQEYLLRLQINQRNKLKKSFEKSYGDLSKFSLNLQKNIFGTFSMGEKLSESLNISKHITTPIVKPITSRISGDDLKKIAEQIDDNKSKPFKDFSSKLDKLVDVTAESIQFMIEANALQTRIAEEIKGSSDSSTKFSKRNIWISGIVLLISTLSFGYSIYTVRESNKSNARYIKEITNGLDSINETCKSNGANANLTDKKVDVLTKEINSLQIDNAKLNQELKKIKSERNKDRKITTP